MKEVRAGLTVGAREAKGSNHKKGLHLHESDSVSLRHKWNAEMTYAGTFWWLNFVLSF